MDLLQSYPLAGFHFLVVFELFPQTPVDVRFQEVSGLSVTMNTESVSEGGENRFVHKLPTRTQYGDLTLKRGLMAVSGVTEWCRETLENYQIKPVNLLVSLLNESHIPLQSWYVVHAYPTKWEVGAFNAEQSQLAIETLTLSYQYFKMLNPASLLAGGLGAITGSASLSL